MPKRFIAKPKKEINLETLLEILFLKLDLKMMSRKLLERLT